MQFPQLLQLDYTETIGYRLVIQVKIVIDGEFGQSHTDCHLFFIPSVYLCLENFRKEVVIARGIALGFQEHI